MRTITYSNTGEAADVLREEHLPIPNIDAGQVLVRVHTSGVNPSDVKARAGTRSGSGSLPFPKIIPHSDGAGVIERVGDGVDKNRIGQRVWIWNGQWQRPFGTAAEYISLNSEQAVPLPDNISFGAGAALGIPAMTACHCVLGGGDITGQTVVISGGAGTVGYLAVQIAKAAGAHVIATAAGDADITRATEAGAHYVIDYKSDTLVDQVLKANNGQAVDRVIEVEFGKNLQANSQIIKEQGRLIGYGSAQDLTPTLPFYPLMFKSVSIELVLVYLLNPAQRRLSEHKVNELLSCNALTIPLHETYDLSDCVSAHQAVETEKRNGSVILSI